MKLSWNGASTMMSTLVQDIKTCREAGYEYIEIWFDKLKVYLEENSIQDLQVLLEENEIQPYAINSLEMITFRNEEDEKKIMKELIEILDLAKVIHCPFIVVVPSVNISDVSEPEIKQETIRVLKKMSDIADSYSTKLAFEFLGFKNCTVNKLEHAISIVNDVNRDNVGFVFDTFHFYVGDSNIDSLLDTQKNKLFLLHINDSEDLPKHQLSDSNRLIPGLGVIPLRSILSELNHFGYDGVIGVEMFRPEYWEKDPIELARECKNNINQLLHF